MDRLESDLAKALPVPWLWLGSKASATRTMIGGLALGSLLPSPPYAAVTTWTPKGSLAVVKVAMPLASISPVPRTVVPLKKVTVPLGLVPVIVEQKVVEPPKVTLLGLAMSEVAVAGIASRES